MGQFNEIETMRFWCQKVLPLVYDDSLSYLEVVSKCVKKLNELIENNKKLPQYIADLIQSYITSGAIADVIHNILTDYMLNVKNPPSGLKSAVGDGSEDDTQAIQGCIDYAFANGGKAVYFPSGVYLTKPLFLKNGVSLFGFDPNTTRLVLKGGSTQPLLNGDSSENTVKGLTFDGNADIQVNNLDLIVMNGGKYIFDDLILKDGYCLLKLSLNESCVVTNVILDNAIQDGIVATGNGSLLVDNIIVNKVSVLNGNSLMTIGVENAIVTNLLSKAKIATGLYIDSNNITVTGRIYNATTPYIDNGNNNTINVLSVSSKENYTGDKIINAENIILNPTQPLTYKEPQYLNEYFNYVPFKHGNIDYKVLVLGGLSLPDMIKDILDAITKEIQDRETAINTLDEKLTNAINTEKQERIDSDTTIHAKLDKIGYVYLQEDEPTIFNNNTIWYEVNGEINCSGDGVSIGNGETSETAPNDATYWFDPIEESEE